MTPRIAAVLLTAALGLGVVVLPADAATRRATAPKHPTVKKGVYRTPGYAGARRLARTGPEPAPPSVTLSATGWKPDVHVDAAGTAHVVWVVGGPPAENGVGNDQVHYCRIPRGAKACDNPSLTPFDPATTPSEDFAGPRILQLGDGLVMLTQRYPVVRDHPDGATSDSTLYASTSTDGGTTWSAPVIVGTQGPQGGALVWGGAAPRISVISDTQTGGTVVQTVTPGQYTRARALLGPGNEAYSGRLALDGEQPVAAFTDLSGYAVVRRLPPGGDPQDPDAWSRAVVPDLDAVDLAGGPAGVYLFGRRPSGGPWSVRRVVDGLPGPAAGLPVPPNGTGPIRDFTQDASGTLHGFYRDGIGATLWGTDSVDGGRSWSPVRLVARSATGTGAIDGVQASAAADGGGVVVYRRDPTGLTSGTVAATAFGPLSPTGKPGAGGRAGAGIPGAFAGCDRVTVGALRATPQQGCLLPSVDPAYPGAAVSQGPIDLNGLLVVPDPGVRIMLDPRRRAIDTSGKVRVILRGAGIDVTLLHAELHIKLDSVASGAPLLDVDPADLDLAGFPIAGRVIARLTPTGVRIPLSLTLPGAFGGITGAATVIAESGRGVRLDSLRIAVGRAAVGPLEVRDLLIAYTGSSETWRGRATLGLPPQPGGAALGADVTFVGGRFRMGNFSLSPPFPGIAIGPNVYFTQLRGGFGLDPVRISVGAGFGAFPIAPPGLYTVGVDGDLELTIDGGTVLLRYTGRGRVVGVALQQVVLNATTDGLADLTAGYDVDLKALAVSGSLQGFVDGPRRQFGASGSAQVRIAGIPAVGQRAALSNEGLGVCYTALGGSFAATYDFSEGLPAGLDVGASLGGCDLGAFEPPARGARAAQAGGTAFPVAAGTKVQNVEITAAGGVPAVVLRAPDGTMVTPVDARTAGARGPASALTLPEVARTVVVLRDPRPGTWTVSAAPGAPAIAGVRVARDVPPVRVTARVTRRGGRRALRYVVRDRGAATVRFAERGPRGAVGDLGPARGARGTIVFEPADGRAGRREIVATVSRGGVPVTATVVARYAAPAARRPAAVRGVRARRSAGAVTVRWRPVPGARGYVVEVRGRTSARRLLQTVGRRSRTARIARVNADDGRLTVTVRAQDRRGRTGAPGRARA